MLSRFSSVQLCATPWIVAHQAPLSMGFSRQEYWSGLPCPPPRDLPNPGTEPRSPALQADSLSSEPAGKLYLNFQKMYDIIEKRLCKGDVDITLCQLHSPLSSLQEFFNYIFSSLAKILALSSSLQFSHFISDHVSAQVKHVSDISDLFL